MLFWLLWLVGLTEPCECLSPRELKAIVAELGSENYRTRDLAVKRLDRNAPAFQRELAVMKNDRTLPLEVRRRLHSVLQRYGTVSAPPGGWPGIFVLAGEPDKRNFLAGGEEGEMKGEFLPEWYEYDSAGVRFCWKYIQCALLQNGGNGYSQQNQAIATQLLFLDLDEIGVRRDLLQRFAATLKTREDRLRQQGMRYPEEVP